MNENVRKIVLSILHLETFAIGILCGAVFGAAVVLSRRISGLLFGVAAIWILFVASTQGLSGLEISVRAAVDKAIQHQLLVMGALAGVVLAVFTLSRRARNERR